MPANLSPEYKKAEAEFRAARDDRERLTCLKEMLRTIPKHKGTESMQADLKSRIKELTVALAGPKKGGARTGPLRSVRREGAAQIALLGPPNAGKSTLHATLTHSRAEIGPYPRSTQEPLPGMLAFEDVHFQLVDLPPISAEHIDAWLPSTLQSADAALVVVDVADPACADDLVAICEALEARKITLSAQWPRARDEQPAADPVDDSTPLPDPFRLELPALLLVNKADLGVATEDIEVLKELTGIRFPTLEVSGLRGDGLEAIGPFLFRELGIVRVYTKAPGKPAEAERPFTLRAGATVLDVARLVHKDLAESLKYARAWGSGVFDGQQVGPEHRVADRDIVELHMR